MSRHKRRPRPGDGRGHNKGIAKQQQECRETSPRQNGMQAETALGHALRVAMERLDPGTEDFEAEHGLRVPGERRGRR